MATTKRELKIVIDGTVKGLQRALKEADSELGQFERGANRLGEAMQRFGKYAAVAAVTGFSAMGAGAIKLGKDMLSGAGEVERYRAILETVTGSAVTAGQKLDWLREFAKSTPFELPGLMDAATKLEAYGFSSEKYLRTLGDTAAALGKNVGDAVEALADATMGEFERLKEFGIKATTEGSKIAFNYVDKSGKQQKALVDKNNQEMIASTLTAIWNERYAGAMEKMSLTWEGMISNLKDNWTSALADIGASLLPTLKPFLDQLIGFVGGSPFKGALESIGSAFVGIASGAMTAIEPFMGLLAALAENFGPLLEQVAGRLGTIFADLFTRLESSGIIDDLARIATVLADEVLDTVERLLPTVMELADLFLDVVAPVVELAGKLGIISGIFQAWVAWKIVDMVRGIAGGLGGAAQNAANLATSAGTATGNLQGAAAAGGSLASTAAGILGVAGALAYTGTQAWNAAKAFKDWTDAEWEAKFATLQWHATVRTAFGDLTEQDIPALNQALNELGYAGETTYDTLDQAFSDIIQSAIRAGKELSFVPPQITQAFRSENPHLAKAGADGMRLYLTNLLQQNSSLAPETIKQVVANLITQFRSGDPAIRQAATDTMKGYLDQMVASGRINETQRNILLNELITNLDLSDQTYNLGTRVGQAYIRGLLAAIPGSYIGPGGTPVVRSPGGGGNIPLYHAGGLVGRWVRAHTGLLAADETPAILQRHEYVIRREAVERYGVGTMEAINRGQAPIGNTYHITGNTFILPEVNDPSQFVPELAKLLANDIRVYQAVRGR